MLQLQTLWPVVPPGELLPIIEHRLKEPFDVICLDLSLIWVSTAGYRILFYCCIITRSRAACSCSALYNTM